MLFDWVRNGDIKAVTEWLALGNDVDSAENGNRLLAIAILNRQWDMAKCLLELEASVDFSMDNVPNLGGNVSLIQIPMQFQRWDLVEQLIRAGADARDCSEYLSPLGYFAQSNNLAMVNYILEKKPTLIDFPSTHSPLKLAIMAGHLNIVQILIAHGASVEKQQCLTGRGLADRFTPIQFAAMFGYREIVDYLIRLPSHNSDHANNNMDLGWIISEVDTLLNSMLPQPPHPRQLLTSIWLKNRKMALRIDLLLLQAGNKNHTLQQAVPRIAEHQLVQRSNEYLSRSLLALDILERSQNPQLPPIITLRYIKSLETMAVSWFCTSIATYVENHLDFKDLNKSKNNQRNIAAWKAIAYLGKISNCAINRGYIYGNQLIGIGNAQIFDAASQSILAAVKPLRDFLNKRDEPTLRTLKATKFYQVSAYLNDCEQLSKLNSLYCDVHETHLHSQDRTQKEAALNAIAATLEIVTVHLSEVSRSYFHDLNFSTLSKIRNHLRHVNGDNHHHDVFGKASRAKRFERLLTDQNPTLMGMLAHFMRHDLSEIRKRIYAYQDFINSIQNFDDLCQRFKEKTDVWDIRKNTVWSYYNFYNYRRNAEQLYNALNEEDVNYPEESEIQRYLRTQTSISNVKNEKTLKEWNKKVRSVIGLTKDYFNHLPKIQREQIKPIVQKLLPIENDNNNTRFSGQICCYLKYASNIHYAIKSLQRINNIKTDFENALDQLFHNDLAWEEAITTNNNAGKETIFRNAIEWQVVHFYEHIAELINDPAFRDAYNEHHGDVIQLLTDVEQIRNYIAHVGNVKFINQNGTGTNQDHFFDLCRHIQDVLPGFQQVQQRWQALLADLIATIPQAKIQEIMAAHVPTVISQNTEQYYRLTNSQLLIGFGIFSAVTAAGVGCYLTAANPTPTITKTTLP